MQVSVESTSDLERKITVGIPAERVDSEVAKRLEDAAKKVRVDGFRKGKVPLKVVKKRFGASVRQEVLGDVINRSLYEALQSESLNPAGTPSVEPKQLEEGKDVEFIATFEVFPEVTLNDIAELEITKQTASIEASDVEKMIETLRKGQAEWQSVECAAAEGHRVDIDFKGTRDGEAFDGGSAEGHKLELGSKQMIPGFEDGIVGMEIGSSKTISVTFPEDYQEKSLAGAEAEFEITLNAVEEQIPPELDQQFFEKFGVQDGGLEDFREKVKENMDRELKKALRKNIKDNALNAVSEANEFALPTALIKSETNDMRQRMIQQYGGATNQLDMASLLPDDMFKEKAEQRIKLGLLINAIIAEEEMKADAEIVRQLIEEQASAYEKPQEMIEYYYGNEQALSNIQAAALEEQVVTLILDKAKVKEEKVSYEEAVKPAYT